MFFKGSMKRGVFIVLSMVALLLLGWFFGIFGEFEPQALQAELVDQSGVVMPLRFLTAEVIFPDQCFGGWSLDSPPTGTNHYVLRLRCYKGRKAVAEFRINKL
jgi:hypothetical protein